jgi:hypothetical protein
MPGSALHEFIDEELLRAPMALDAAVDAVYDQWRVLRAGSAIGRGHQDPARLLQHHRGELMATALQALRESMQDDLALDRSGVGAAAAGLGRTPTAGAAARPGAGPSLSLIDEDDVSADIEIARAIEAVKLRAEAELRELQTYTSTLVGDPNVSRDTNPMRPEVVVRALWRGVQTLPLPRATQAAFMHAAAEPLAQALKMGYGAAARRLDERGVTPAAHRTIVYTGATLYGVNAPRYRAPPDLNAVRDSLSGPLDASPTTTSWPRRQAADAAAAAAPMLPLPALPPLPADSPAPAEGARPAAMTGADPQLILLLTRLFDELHGDRSLPSELCMLLLRLQPAALRVALQEPALLDTYDHPVWRFMDALAQAVTLSPPADRMRVLGMGRNMVDHLVADEVPDSQRFAWAIDRLAAMNRHALAQALAAAQPEIDRLRQRLNEDAAATTGSAPLDIGNLDTVPADLLPDGPSAAPAGALPNQPGDHLRAWLQGDWRVLQLLWLHDEATPGQPREAPGMWLLREPAADRLWAVRPAAMERLAAEQLAQPLHQRSLVRRAAERVLRAL